MIAFSFYILLTVKYVLIIMDFQTRKLKAIEFLIGINSEEAFGKIEATIMQTIYDEGN